MEILNVKDTIYLQHTRKDGTVDIKQADYVLKNYKNVAVNGGILQIGDSKPTISKTMYYDDETAAPSTVFESFREYNMRGNSAALLSEVIKERPVIWVYVNHTNDKTGGRLRGWVATKEWETPRLTGYRLATKTEITAIALGMLNIRRDFEKRLRTYFKRYNNKIHTHGYWANR